MAGKVYPYGELLPMDTQIDDPLFGRLTHFQGLLWEGKIDSELLGPDTTLYLDADNGPDDYIRALFTRFMASQTQFKPVLQEALFAHYQSICDEWRDLLEEDADEFAPVLQTSDQIWSLLSDPTLVLHEQVPDRPDLQIELRWNATWEVEHGLSVSIVDGQIAEFD